MNKQIYHVFVRNDLSGASSFDQGITVPFTPSKVRVNYIAYYNGETETQISFLRANALIRNDQSGIIGCFTDSQTPIVLGSEFNLGYQINGTFQFQILDIALALDSGRNGTIVVDLQFES